jgi:O-antigen/teichoic acid export membrane protein
MHLLNRKHISDTFWVITGKVINIIGALALIKLLTTMLSTAEYGMLALALTGFGLVTQLLMGPIGQAIGRFYSHSIYEGGGKEFSYVALKLLRKIAIIVVIACLALILFLNLINQQDLILLIIYICIYSYIFGVSDILNGLHNLARNRKTWVATTSVESLLKILIAFLLLENLGQTPEVVLTALILSSLFTLAYQAFNIKKLSKYNFEKEGSFTSWKSEISSLAVKAALWGPVVWLQQSSDRWSLQYFSGSHEVGLYAVLYQVSYAPMILVGGAIATLITPYLYDRSHTLSSRYKFMFLTILVFTLFSALVAEFFLVGMLLPSLVSREYLVIAEYVPLMILAGGLWASGDILIINLLGQMKSGAVLYIKVLSSIFGILINILGAKYYDVIGVVYAQIMYCGIYAGFSYLWISLHYSKSNV